MATDKDIVFKVSVDTEGGKSLKDLKTEFNEVQKELGKAKQGSEEYLKSLQKLGNLKDQIGDLRAEISGLTPEGKVQAFQNVASGLASGFQAATGAAALFGVQSGEVEKQLLKVQAVMAFTEGIKGIVGMKDAFLVLNNVIRSNPIVALATALVALTAAFVGFNMVQDESVEMQKKWNDEMERANDLAKKNNQLMIENTTRQEGRLNDIKREIVLMQAAGASQADINKKRLEAIDEEVRNLELLKATLLPDDYKTRKEYNEKIIALYTDRMSIISATGKAEKDAAKKAGDEARELKKKNLEKENEDYKDAWESQVKTQTEAEENLAKQAADKKAQDNEDFENAWKEQSAKLAAGEENLSKEAADKKKKQREQELQAEKDLAMAKDALTQNSIAAAQSLSATYFNWQLSRAKGNQIEEAKIRKKQFEVDKAFSIARTVIDGVRSVQAALTIAPPAGYILAAANAILAVANIAKIASTQFNAGSVASSGGGDISGPSMPTNSGPIITQAPTTLTRQGTNLGPNGENLTQVVMVESQASDVHKRVAKLKEQATF